MAISLLRAPTAFMRLSHEEAAVVLDYMQPGSMPVGLTFIRQGDEEFNDFMMLILQGDVAVEAKDPRTLGTSTLTVLGPGSLIGEMALLDGEPRYASCTASTEVLFARLRREDFQRLLQEQPVIGNKLLLAIAFRLTARLRDTTDKLKVTSRLVTTLQQELEHLLPTPGGIRRTGSPDSKP